MLNDSEIVVVRHFVGLFIVRIPFSFFHNLHRSRRRRRCRCRLHRRRHRLRICRLYRYFIVAGAAFCRTKN